MEMWSGSRDYDEWLGVPETAALLRKELKRSFPYLKCTVKVEHRWHGWIRVRATGAFDPTLVSFLDGFQLLRFDSTTDLRNHHINTVQIGGSSLRIINDVTSIRVEWMPEAAGRRC